MHYLEDRVEVALAPSADQSANDLDVRVGDGSQG
jgi:hypothetical protein